MSAIRETIALAGVGNLGKYLCEEFISDERYEVVVISRKKSTWLEKLKVDVRISDYSEDSVLSILDSTNATALISLISCPNNLYLPIHCALLSACTRSGKCKRFIPSEWIGNIEVFPHLPRFYGDSREPFRQILKSSSIQWTLFNCGWLMDYLLPKEKTYMPPIPDEFPVDPNNWRACIRGSGDELQSFTCARDIGRAVLELLAAAEWVCTVHDPIFQITSDETPSIWIVMLILRQENVTYVSGEWCTFNDVVSRMEKLKGRPLEISYKTKNEINKVISDTIEGSLTRDLEIALVEEWMVAGASACPREKTLLQREKYFHKMKFSNIEELLVRANTEIFI